MNEELVPLLTRMAEKVGNMRPIPPCENLFDQSWGKVDKLILKTMKAMMKKGVERPLHPFSETFFDMAMQDLIDNAETTPGLQAAAFRVMDTRLLVDEFGRMRQMAVLIREAARGEDVEFPFHDFPPKFPSMTPPCFTQEVYDNSAAAVVSRFADELRDRGILPPRKQE